MISSLGKGVDGSLGLGKLFVKPVNTFNKLLFGLVGSFIFNEGKGLIPSAFDFNVFIDNLMAGRFSIKSSSVILTGEVLMSKFFKFTLQGKILCFSVTGSSWTITFGWSTFNEFFLILSFGIGILILGTDFSSWTVSLFVSGTFLLTSLPKTDLEFCSDFGVLICKTGTLLTLLVVSLFSTLVERFPKSGGGGGGINGFLMFKTGTLGSFVVGFSIISGLDANLPNIDCSWFKGVLICNIGTFGSFEDFSAFSDLVTNSPNIGWLWSFGGSIGILGCLEIPLLNFARPRPRPRPLPLTLMGIGSSGIWFSVKPWFSIMRFSSSLFSILVTNFPKTGGDAGGVIDDFLIFKIGIFGSFGLSIDSALVTNFPKTGLSVVGDVDDDFLMFKTDTFGSLGLSTIGSVLVTSLPNIGLFKDACWGGGIGGLMFKTGTLGSCWWLEGSLIGKIEILGPVLIAVPLPLPLPRPRPFGIWIWRGGTIGFWSSLVTFSSGSLRGRNDILGTFLVSSFLGGKIGNLGRLFSEVVSVDFEGEFSELEVEGVDGFFGKDILSFRGGDFKTGSTILALLSLNWSSGLLGSLIFSFWTLGGSSIAENKIR